MRQSLSSFRRPALGLSVCAAIAALAGCGGGNGSSGSGVLKVSATQSVTAQSGASASLTGFATTAGQSITSATWTQISGPALALSNANCATAATSKLSSAASGAGAQMVNYTCALGVQIPPATSSQTYQFRFTVTDALGNTQSATTTLTADAAQTQPLVVAAGPNANLYPGQSYKGSCVTTGGFYANGQTPTYQWSIQGPSGVTPPALTASGPTVSLTAGYPASQQNYTLTCQVTDGAGNSANGTAALTVYGTSALPLLVANAGPAQVVTTGAAVQLSGSATTASASSSSTSTSGTTSSSSSTSSSTSTAPVYYYWKQTGGTNQVVLANANTPTPSFVAPQPAAPASGASAPASGSVYDTLTFTEYVSYQPIDPSQLSQIPASQQATTVVTVVNQ